MNWKRQFRNDVELFRDGEFELDCPEMELVQDVAEGAELYRGPGFIRQDPEGRIRFKIYPIETQNPPCRQEVGEPVWRERSLPHTTASRWPPRIVKGGSGWRIAFCPHRYDGRSLVL